MLCHTAADFLEVPYCHLLTALSGLTITNQESVGSFLGMQYDQAFPELWSPLPGALVH